MLINTGGNSFLVVFVCLFSSPGKGSLLSAKVGGCLCPEAVEGLALPLECVHHVQGGHGLAACVLRVGHGVTDDVLQEHLEHTTGLLVDQPRDALHATTASQAADGGLGDALDVVAENLAVTLGPTLAQTLTTLTTARHC